MKLHPLTIVLLPFLGTVACSGQGGPGELEPTRPSWEAPVPSGGGSESGSGSTSTSMGSPSPSASSTPTKDSNTTSSGSGSATLGPQCTAYLSCCDEVASKNAGVGSACDSTRTQIEDAQTKGVSTSSYESACKSALDSMKSAGYCG